MSAKTRRKTPSRRRARERSKTAATQADAVEIAVVQSGDSLTKQERAFVALYDKHLGNGTRAWMELHPGCSAKSAGEGASRMARKIKIRDAVDALRKARWKRMQMEADEALALVAGDARADVRALFDDDGKILPPHLWPDDIAASVESVDMANGKVKLAGKAAARRTMLEQTGAVKGVGAGLDSLAKILAGNFEEEAPK